MMKPIAKIVVLICILTFGSFSAIGQFSRKPFVSDELLVKFKNSQAISGFSNRHNLRGFEKLKGSEWTRILLPKGAAADESIRLFESDADVEAVQPNFYYYLAAIPNDTRFGELWGMTKISAPAAWDITTGSSSTVVAVIDTGIKYDHEDLAANIWTNSGEIAGNSIDDDGNGYVDDVYGYDFRFDDGDPLDEHGHGTHVAGTIGAVGNNALGVTGVNWNVRLMAIKIYDATGFGTTSAMLINSYNYVTIMRQSGVNIRVTNNSYSGCDEACGYDQATKDALDAMGNAGILNVFAAGNDNRDIEAQPAFPASYTSPSVVSVASSTSADVRSSFSNFGTTSVDLAAPGSGILSSIFNGTGYGNKSGTSMASPHVAGAAALLSSHNPALSPMSLKASILNSADPLANWSGLVRTGARLNVASALTSQTVCDITLNPASQHIFPEGGSFQFSVSSANNCDYSVSKDAGASFVTVTSQTPGSGDSIVTYTAGQNSGLPLGGHILVGDKQFQVSQSPGKLFPHRGFLDFDGDGMTDYTAIQNINGQMIWHIYSPITGYTAYSFGLFNDDIPVPGHFDSDLVNDIAIWRRSTGTFYVLRSIDQQLQVIRFGLDGDDPTVTQDFDGDDINDFAVARKQDGKLVWYILRSSDWNVSIFQFGNDTDKPIRGDYDGDGKADPAVYRPQSGSPANTFFVLRSSDQNLLGVTFGISTTDKVVPNDYDGDGKTDIAVWRETTGVWHHLRSSDGQYQAYQFGLPGDLPVPGDYDGDGRTEYSVWRAGSNGGSGIFYKQSLWQGFGAVQWGNDSMVYPAEVLRTP